VGDETAAVAASDALFEQGFWVPAIRPPTVPAGTSRLRFTFSASHTTTQVDQLLAALHALNRSGVLAPAAAT
jgi:8-amino-7-oxononanoate synthase